jgi:acyl-CoA synthetase (AMP-forming)/AMP-acid ligase II
VSIYDHAPWLTQYGVATHASIAPTVLTMSEIFDGAVRSGPDRPVLHYFECSMTYSALDEAADAFACELLEIGLRAGDRVAL